MSRGLQLQSMWRIPAVAVSEHVVGGGQERKAAAVHPNRAAAAAAAADQKRPWGRPDSWRRRRRCRPPPDWRPGNGGDRSRGRVAFGREVSHGLQPQNLDGQSLLQL